MTERYYAGVGSRETPAPVLLLMEGIASKLADDGWTLRSGGAPGADQAFARGAAAVQGKLELYLPWGDFERKSWPAMYPGMRILPNPDGWTREAAEYFHPNWNRLSQGSEKLMMRNVHQVLGRQKTPESEYLVCWTPGGRGEGGTGQALRIAKDLGIRIRDLGTPESEYMMRRWLRLAGKNSTPP